jgi:hypothetical protein
VSYVNAMGVGFPIARVLISSVYPFTDGAGGNYLAINGFQVDQVLESPEPSSMALIGLGALVLLINRRRLASLIS